MKFTKLAFLIALALFAPKAEARNFSDRIYAYQGFPLQTGDYLYSSSGAYFLVMQEDCNLVVYANLGHGQGRALWSSRTAGRGSNCSTYMQTDGNLVVYDQSGAPLFSANTGGKGNRGSFLVMQDDGNLVVYADHYSNRAIWASNTVQAPNHGGGRGRGGNGGGWGRGGRR